MIGCSLSLSLKSLFLTLAFLSFSKAMLGQLSIVGKVTDIETEQGIPFVNIGIVDEGIGTVSNVEGSFTLEIEDIHKYLGATLLFSSLGYKKKEVPIKNVIEHGSLSNINVLMEPTNLALDEVVVSNKGKVFIPDGVGYRNYGENVIGYWKDDIALGGELATRILVKDGLRKLNKLQFEIKENQSDSLLLRINIYDDDGGLYRLPRTNLNNSKKNILYTVKHGYETVLVDLTPYDIYVKDNFILALELVEVYGKKKPALALLATSNRFGSYRRYASQGNWVKISAINMAYVLETELLVTEEFANRYDRLVARKEARAKVISGKVTDNGEGIENVLVFNLRTKITTKTNKEGFYKIHAKRNDVLTFSKKEYQVFTKKVKSGSKLEPKMTRKFVLPDNGFEIKKID